MDEHELIHELIQLFRRRLLCDVCDRNCDAVQADVVRFIISNYNTTSRNSLSRSIGSLSSEWCAAFV